MAILQLPTQVPGMVGVQPNFKFMVCTDNLATVITAGYLNQFALESNPVSATDILNVLYSFNQQTQSGTYEQFGVTISNGVITLVPLSGAGEVVLPTVANHIASFTNINGTIASDVATAINGGNIQAGLSGTAGTLASYPATAGKGALVLAGVANTGNTLTTISNAAMGQASVVSIPDPGNAVARFVVGATATPFVNGNFPVNSGTAGLMVDSGVAASALAQTANVVVLSPAADQTITARNFTVAAGNITAGATTGVAGNLVCYSSSASKGSLILSAVANTGNTATTISNAAMGQASVISIPDPGAATASFVLTAATGTQTIGSAVTVNNTLTGQTINSSTGNITSGSSGVAGTLTSFPTTASKGTLVLAAVANTGNTATTISNVAMGQASVVSIPDPANAIGRFLVAATATPFVSGNFPVNSGTGGLMVDSAIAASALMQNNIVNTMTAAGIITMNKVNGTEAGNAVTASGVAGLITTSSLSTAGGASYAITWTNTKITATSVVLLQLAGGTNTTNALMMKVVPGSGTATLTIYNLTAATALNGTLLISYLVM